jgi:hypothetical protein
LGPKKPALREGTSGFDPQGVATQHLAKRHDLKPTNKKKLRALRTTILQLLVFYARFSRTHIHNLLSHHHLRQFHNPANFTATKYYLLSAIYYPLSAK